MTDRPTIGALHTELAEVIDRLRAAPDNLRLQTRRHELRMQIAAHVDRARASDPPARSRDKAEQLRLFETGRGEGVRSSRDGRPRDRRVVTRTQAQVERIRDRPA